MAGTITPANIAIGYDGSKLKIGIDGTRSQLGKLQQDLKASLGPSHGFNERIRVLTAAFAKGAVTNEAYTRTLRHIHAEMRSGSTGGPLAGYVKSIVATGAAYLTLRTAIAAARMAVTGFISRAQEIDKINDAAKKLAISYGDLIVLRQGLSETSGMDEGAIDVSMGKMQIALAKARDEGGKLADHLSAIGLDAGELLKQGPVAAMITLSQHMREMKDPADQLRLSLELFGKGGTGLVVSLRDGAGALLEMNRFTEEWGGKLSTIQTEQIDAMNDSFGRIQMAVDGITGQITAELAPVFTVMAKEALGIASPFHEIKDILPSIVDESVRFAAKMTEIGRATAPLLKLGEFAVGGFGTGIFAPMLGKALGQDIKNSIEKDRGDQGSLAEQWLKKINEEREAAKKLAEERENRKLPGGIDFNTEAEKKLATAKKKTEAELLAATKARLREEDSILRARQMALAENAKPMIALLDAQDKLDKSLADNAKSLAEDNASFSNLAPLLKAGSVEAYKFMMKQKDDSLQKQMLAKVDVQIGKIDEAMRIEKDQLDAIRNLNPVVAIR